MQSVGMRGEPEYDMDKFGEVAEVTDPGYWPATQAQREVSARRGPTKLMKG